MTRDPGHLKTLTLFLTKDILEISLYAVITLPIK